MEMQRKQKRYKTKKNKKYKYLRNKNKQKQKQKTENKKVEECRHHTTPIHPILCFAFFFFFLVPISRCGVNNRFVRE